MALGEGRVGALGATVGDLDGAKELLLQAVAALFVEHLVGLAERGQGDPELLDGAGHAVEQSLPGVGRGVGHRPRLFTDPG